MFPLIVIAIIATCDGWGSSIHREITSIALRHLSSNKVAKKYLLDHLGTNENIIRASTWADTDEAAVAYPESEDLHFSNTPWRECAEFDMTRDCGFDGSGRCIVSGIADFAMVAIDQHQPLAKRVDAIKYLLHLVGDIHQPLHTGFAEDNGGVNIQLATDPVASLHQMWDYGIWETNPLKKRSDEIRYEPIKVILDGPIGSRDSVIEYASALASESSRLLTCTFAYRNEAGSFIKSREGLSEEYLSSRRAIIASRIELAGKRLANLISVIATSFAVTSGKRTRTVPVASLTTTTDRPRNQFEVLPIEFEPDDYVESVACTLLEDTSSSRPEKAKKKPRTGVDDAEIPVLPLAAPEKVGNIFLTDITLVKRRERFIVTCRSVLATCQNIDDYDPILVLDFRVRFGKNRKRTEPVVFFADSICFGGSLSKQDFIKIIYFLSGNDLSQVPAIPSAPVSVHEHGYKDLLDIHPIDGEYYYRSEFTGRPSRGWNPLYYDDPVSVHTYLKTLEIRHHEEQIAQRRWAMARNITIEQKWEIEFFTKLKESFVFVVGNGRLQVIVHRNSLTDKNLPAMRFAMYGCVADAPVSATGTTRHTALGEDVSFTMLIDTGIFDGIMTNRISKGLASLQSRSVYPEPGRFERPSFLDELWDIDSILHRRGLYRADQFRAIREFYMIPQATTSNIVFMAYIEWSIRPTVFQPLNETLSH